MKKALLFLMLGAASAAPALADQMKPGLWEMTIKSGAVKNLPKLSPQQMEQMRRMGVEVPQFQDGGIVSKVCITPQMAASEAPGLDTSQTGCESKNLQRGGGKYSADVVCSGEMMKGTGKLSGTYSGNERFSATYDFKGNVYGQPVSQRQETSGRWLGAECGSVKPFGN